MRFMGCLNFLWMADNMCFLFLVNDGWVKHSWLRVFRDLTKLYMFSYRTNEEKLLCLKYLGRILSANSLELYTTNPLPSWFQFTTAWLDGF